MARSTRAQIGDNSGEPLTDDERGDLIAYYGIKIRGQRAKADEAKAAYDLERQEVNNLFALVKGDLQYARKEFEAVLAELDMTEAEFRRHIAKTDTLRRLAGLPVGEQIDLLEHVLKDTVDEANETEANGLRAGLRGDPGIPPDHVAPILQQDWLRGWDAGQAELGARMVRAQELIARRGEPDVEDDDVDLNAEDDDPTDPDLIDEKARALKKSGFLERGEPGADNDQAAA